MTSRSGKPYNTTPEPLAEDRPVWEKQPGGSGHPETAKAFSAFETYRVLGGSKRSIAKAAVQLGKSMGTVGRWAQRWGWTRRAAAWDEHLAAESREAEVSAMRDLREREINFGQAMQAAGGSKLAEINAAIEAGEPLDITTAEARQLIDLGTRMERRARGEPEAIHRHEHENIEVSDFTDEELDRIDAGEDVDRVMAGRVH